MNTILESVAHSLLLVAGFSLASASSAQSFSTVINIPADQPTFTGTIGSDTQFNLSDGGTVIAEFNVGDPSGTSTNVEANITGGTINAAVSFYAGSTINISGGAVPTLIIDAGSETNISGGLIGGFGDFGSGGVINVSGGEVEGVLLSSGEVNLSGGILGTDTSNPIGLDGSSVLNMSGGTIASGILASGTINLSGGTVSDLWLYDTTDDFGIVTQSGQLNLLGTDLLLDAQPIPGLTIGATVTLPFSDGGILTGQLSDGSPFAFEIVDAFDGSPQTQLNSVFLEPNAALNVTLVPEPSTLLLTALAFGLLLRARR